MAKQDTVRVSLCGGDKCCPEVRLETGTGQVHIGEAGNLVTLTIGQWNELVAKVRSGELQAL